METRSGIKVRMIEVNDKPMFCGSDVAKALGYAIPSKAVNTHCKGASKMETPTKGGKMTERIVLAEKVLNGFPLLIR